MSKITKNIVRKVCFIILTTFLCPLQSVQAQDKLKADSITLLSKERYITISSDFLSISLQYEKKVNPTWYAGVEVMGGMGFRYIIGKSIKEIDYQSGELYDGNVSKIIETGKIDISFSNYLSKIFVQKFGVYGSVISPGEGNYYFASGVEYSLYYGFNRFKIGHRLQLGIVFLRFRNHSEVNYNALYGSITPIIIQFKF